jgi:hypothetical protein
MTHSTHHNRIKNHKRAKQSRTTKNTDTQKMAYAMRGGRNFN